MSDSKSLLIGLGSAAGLSLALHMWSRRASSNVPLPASPKSYPLIGNLLSMPQENQHLGFMELGKQLKTDVFSLRVFGTVIIVLNSVEAASDLLEKRAKTYSDRVCPPMLSEPSLVDFAGILSLLPYSDRWRKSRRLIHPWLHRNAATAFHESQQQEARKLLQRLAQRARNLQSSEDLYAEFFSTLSRTLMYSIYGYRVQGMDDSFVVEFKTAMDNAAEAAMPSNFLVNLFPLLRHVPNFFPGTDWKETARRWRKQQQAIIMGAYNWTKSQMNLGNQEASNSITASMISLSSRLKLTSKETDDLVSQAGMALITGGADTSANVFLVFVIAMIQNPEVQNKAQQEIDGVIGQDRLPTVQDQQRLPYIGRLIQELMRWCPILPTGVPHACLQDDVYNGHRFPKGSIVFANTWAMSRDERYYKAPESFDPDRFLDPAVPPCPVFGFGRRQCPGLHYAESSIFIVVASLLSAFSFLANKEESGETTIPTLDSNNVIVFHPKPFKLQLKLRSSTHEKLLKAGL